MSVGLGSHLTLLYGGARSVPVWIFLEELTGSSEPLPHHVDFTGDSSFAVVLAYVRLVMDFLSNSFFL